MKVIFLEDVKGRGKKGEQIHNNAAIVIGEDDVQYDSVVAAQAADALLQMIGIEASFVISRRDDNTVAVSARSTGSFNVQLVMEVSRIEATAMLAGIQVDTKSFTLRSGTRTFDAASYLRSVGADGKMLQDFMKETVDSYRERAHLIERADHSKPSISESTEVYHQLSERVVIIDHHRRGEEFPDEPQLVYIESYASSTSELVTELFEYQPRRTKGPALGVRRLAQMLGKPSWVVYEETGQEHSDIKLLLQELKADPSDQSAMMAPSQVLSEATERSLLVMVLGRGGDQVVVKSPTGDARFYGGNTNPMAKRTRVRARVISQALADLMTQADQIFIMGHKRSDMDSFGTVDRYMLIGYREGLRRAEADKFNVLTAVREATSMQNTPITLSIGIAYKETAIDVLAQNAQANLDLALLDATDSAQVMSDYEAHKLFIGIVSLDNYDEVSEGMNDSDASALRTFVTKTLSDWMAEHKIYVRRLKINWVNPYLQSFLGERVIVGRPMQEASVQLADLIKRWPDEDKRVTQLHWLDRVFNVQVQPELRAAYLMVNWVAGIVWLALVVIALMVIFKTLQIIGEDTTHYIENLSYRVNRGEQEAIIQMPLGVILFNEQNNKKAIIYRFKSIW
ncbi:DHH family phosphoesterase [Weissella confusa]|uniref:DHH family phosphoesterase n=1 Tax=Weissella confusa TaxID=1583 RepID=A0A923NIH0_WEICO|nr:DHH family phosphoesterase [Weissella confusa]